jgi:hypothetical protein
MDKTYGLRMVLQVVADSEDGATVELGFETLAVRGERNEVIQLVLKAGEQAFDLLKREIGGEDGRTTKA